MLRYVLHVCLTIVGCVWVSEVPAAPPQRWAMLVGVDQYARIEGLEFAGNDQRALAAELVKVGFPQDQIILLHDVAKQKRNLPFRENIERELDLLLNLTNQGDILVFAFSGHGVHINGKSYLCPTEADLDRPSETLIPLDSVFERLGKSKASIKVMFVDACRNDPRPSGARGVRGDRSITNRFTESLEAPPKGLLLMTSCGVGEKSMEDTKLQHGVFMYHILEGLRGKAANVEGVITLSSLYDYCALTTKKYVANRWSDYQSPGFKGELTGPFEFARINRILQQATQKKAEQAEDSEKSMITGIWNGTYSYPAYANRAPVNFTMIFIQDGMELSGFIKEKNTFGNVGDPWLHASFRGRFDPNTLRIDWVKTYDGTADVSHDVRYAGRVSGDGKRVLSGAWEIPNSWGANFTLSKDPETHAGKWSGIWTGTRYYPEVSNRSPSKFSMIIAQKGNELVGYINERRTLIGGEDPWFHATVKGRVNETTGEVTFTKSYDGTAGLSDQFEYHGKQDEGEAMMLSGTWKPRSGSGGTFTLMKAPHSR